MARARKGRRRPRQRARPRPSVQARLQRVQRLKKQAILRSMDKGATRTAAAAAAGIDRATLWRWAQADPKFDAALQLAEQQCISRVEGALFKAALKPDGRTDRIFYLKTRAGYVERGIEKQIEARAGYYDALARRDAPPPELKPERFEFVITSRQEHNEPAEQEAPRPKPEADDATG